MASDAKNISIVGTDFVRRLRELRQERHLSKSDLAEAAGLSYRTVHDLEANRRTRVLEKTVMLLAAALDVSVDELLGPPETRTTAAPSRRFGRGRLVLVLVAALIVVSALATAIGWHVAARNATWDIDGRVITARDGITGLEIWRFESEGDISLVAEAPWSADEIIVGHTSYSVNGHRVLCLERSSGAVLWEFRLNPHLLEAAFGRGDMRVANMGLNHLVPVDLNGDDEKEVIVCFIHGYHYQTSLCWIDRNGKLLGQYVHKGHLLKDTVTDLDGDGFEDFVAFGTNNSKAYQGATIVVLDRNHFRGASVDSLTDSWSVVPDSARVRVVFPAFPEPYQTLMVQQRLHVRDLKIVGGGVRPRLLADIGTTRQSNNRLTVLLDADLRPLDVEIKDDFRDHIATTWPDSLKYGTGPADPRWRETWLDGYIRFEAGHWPAH
jgi:transcriptional regulator with XRE-family HTH domain